MNETEHAEQFVRDITEHQNRIFAYVYSLLGNESRTADVVQETNLTLWRKMKEFDPSRPFLPWAFAIARNQVLAHIRDSQRDRMLLDAELAESLSTSAEQHSSKFDALRTALRRCLVGLPEDSRTLIEQRYLQSKSIAAVAESTGRTANATKVNLLRIRRQLGLCIEKRMAAEG